MTNAALSQSAEQVKDKVQDVVRDVAPWVARVGRIGLAFRGLVYLLVGGLAGMAAVGAGGRTTGTRGAVEWIVHQPFGVILLTSATVGLIGFSAWQLLLMLPFAHPRWVAPLRPKRRLLCLSRALGNLGLAMVAINVLVAGSHGSGEEVARDWTGWVMGYPLGRWVVACVGLGVAGYGMGRIIWSIRKDPTRNLDLSGLPGGARSALCGVGKFGNAARGAVFGMAGGFLLASAYYQDPSRARGLGGTMAALQRQPYGPALLGIAAAGLAAFGLFCILSARYYRPHPT